MKNSKLLVLVVVFLLMISTLVACSSTSTEPEANDDGEQAAAEESKTLTMALSGEPQSLDPFAHSNQLGFIPTTLIFETLIKKDDNGEFYPWLAESFEVVDNTTILFKLRQDVTFHDGTAFTAEDVKFSLTMAAESSFSKNLFGSIDTEGFNIIDDYTIEVNLTSPNAAILEAIASHRGAMINEGIYTGMTQEKFARAPVGTGPMVFDQWVTGDRIEFSTNENYWGEAMPFDKFVARVILEASSRAIELETGGVDIAYALASTDWERIDSNPDTVLLSGIGNTTTFITINSSIEPLNDERVRKALAYGTNMEALVKTAWNNTAEVATSYYTPNLLGQTQVGPMEYDVEKAKALLAEAGYADGLTITFVTFEKPVYMSVAEVLQNMWKNIGVTIDLQIVDLATFTTMNNAGEIPVSAMTTTAAIPDPAAALMIWPTARTISVRHNDVYVDELMNEGISTFDIAEREAAYGELQEYLWENMYTIPAANPQSAYGTSSEITNFPFARNLCPDLTRIEYK